MFLANVNDFVTFPGKKLERNYDLAFERFAGEISKEKKKSERRIEKVPEPQRKLTKRAHPKDKAKSTEESLTMFETL